MLVFVEVIMLKNSVIHEQRRPSLKINFDCEVNQIVWTQKHQTHCATRCGLDMEVFKFHGLC